MRTGTLLLALLAGVLPVTRAVIIDGVDGTINITAPANGAPWDHVGTIGNLSGVYLGAYGGGYWVITANHVGIGDFTVNSNTYTAVGGSGVQIAGADLFAFRIATEPPLTALPLSATAPVTSSGVTMIGHGRNRDTGPTTWYVDVDTNPDTWSTSFSPGISDASATGYFWGSGNTMRWGPNQIAGTAFHDNTWLLYTTFDNAGDAQGAEGDSGGGVFYKNGSTWELAGIMAYVATFDGQPASTAVADNDTQFVDVSVYRSAILTAIPEPASAGAWCAGLGVLVVTWHRRRRT